MGAGMLGRVEVLGGRPDPLAPSRLSPTSAYQKRMRSGDLVPVSGRNPIPSWPARNRQRSVPQMHVCKLFSGVSNAGAESYDAWAQRSLKAKGGEKFSLRGHRVPAGPPQGKGWDAELRTYGCCAGRGEKGAKSCVPTANAIPVGPEEVWGQRLHHSTVSLRYRAMGPRSRQAPQLFPGQPAGLRPAELSQQCQAPI